MDVEQEQRFIIDRVGEKTDLEECALCHAASCFACVSDHCTALKKLADGGCTFYRDHEETRRDIHRCFYRLIANERFDLLMKYADTIAALGLMDYEKTLTEKERERLEKHRVEHLKELEDQNWKDSLVIVYPDDEAEEADDEEPEDLAPDTADQAAVFDNSMDSIDLPAGATDETIDDETAEEIQTRDHILREEIKDENFHMYEILHDANERIVMETGEDDLPEDYGEQEDLSVDENGNLLGYEEYIERAQEAEREKEAEEEKKIQMAQEKQEGTADGEEAYVSLPINFFFRKIGFPVRRKQPMDPVILACGNLGANIVYQAAEDYIATLRMLWSGEYDERLYNRLVVQKWQLETFIGSRLYWQFTSISPERILDQCWKTARRKAEAKIERANKRTAAGVEDGNEG